MATLQKIRDRGTMLVIVIGVALLAFVLGDLFTSGTTLFGKARDKAFTVNDEIVSTQEYANRITEWEEFQKMVSGQTSLDENATLQIRDAVYQQMIRERMLDNQTEKLGLTVSKAEMNDLVHGNAISPLLQQLPFFVNPQTGVFDKDALVQFISTVNTPAANASPEEQAVIAQYKSIWMFIEKMIKYQRLEEKYISLLSMAMTPNDVEAKTAFDMSQSSADIAYVKQSYFTVADSTVNVTDADVKAFYDKNKELFKLESPLVKVSYFAKDVIPSEQDFAEVSERANQAFAQLKDAQNVAPIVAEYSDVPYRDVYLSEQLLTPDQLNFARNAVAGEMYGPVKDGDTYQVFRLMNKTVAADSVRLRMMAVPDATVAGQEDRAKLFVDSLYNELQAGKTFAEVANSLNPQSNGGEIGWAREIDLVAFGSEIATQAFSAPIGQPVKVKIPGQQVIMQVEERTSPVQKYKLAVVSIPVIPSEKTSNNVDNELNQFVSAKDVSKKFNEMAAEKGYSVIPNMTVSANDFGLAQIPNSRQIISWAVNEKPGAVRKFDLANSRIIARVDEVITSEYTPMTEVASNIRARLSNDKKAEKIIADLKAKNLTSLDAYASALNTTVDTIRFVNYNTQNIAGLGFEPVLNAVAAFATPNQVSAPQKGNMGVYVTNVLNRTQGSATYNKDTQKQDMMNQNAYRVQMQSMEVLKNKLGVKDNRYKFF